MGATDRRGRAFGLVYSPLVAAPPLVRRGRPVANREAVRHPLAPRRGALMVGDAAFDAKREMRIRYVLRVTRSSVIASLITRIVDRPD